MGVMSGTLGLVQRYYAGAHVHEGVLCFDPGLLGPLDGLSFPMQSTAGPAPIRSATAIPNWMVEAGEIMGTAYEPHQDDDDFIQPGTLYRQVMMSTDREHLVTNIVAYLGDRVERFIQERAVNEYRVKVDPDLGARVAEGLGLATPQRSRR